MPSTRTLLTALVAFGAFFGTTIADVIQIPPDNPDSVDACYDSPGELFNAGPNTYQSQGACRKQCLAAEKAVYAVTKGQFCFCGDYVPESGKVDLKKCNRPCQGYGQTACGGDTTWLFGYTGALPPDVPEVGSSASSSKTPKPTTSSTKSVAPVQTTVVIQEAATVTAPVEADDAAQAKSKSTTNKAGIAAGIVVGVVAVIGIGLGAFLVVRRNRRMRAEEEYKAAVANKEFTASIRKPANDARLDPVMLQRRRLSDGSIADNQDFSRRILKVTNPDNS